MKRSLIIVFVAMLLAPLSFSETEMKVVAKMSQPPINLTVSPAGDIYVTMMPFMEPDVGLYKIDKYGNLHTYPNRKWSRGGKVKKYVGLDSPVGVQCDRNGVLWILDPGSRNGVTQKIVAWDTVKNQLVRIIQLPPPATYEGSFINDLAVDLDNQAIYISDSGAKCIVVVDLKTGNARSVLREHKSVMEEDKTVVIDGKALRQKNEDGSIENLYLPMNPLAADAKNEYVYYGALNGTSLYRIKSEYLRDFSLNDRALAGKVERYSDKPQCDGIGIDREGNIYITDLCNNAIGVIDAKKKYTQLVRDDNVLNWPDSIAYGPDGYYYTLAHQIHRAPRMNAGMDAMSAPYNIIKFKGLAPGVIGR